MTSKTADMKNRLMKSLGATLILTARKTADGYWRVEVADARPPYEQGSEAADNLKALRRVTTTSFVSRDRAIRSAFDVVCEQLEAESDREKP